MSVQTIKIDFGNPASICEAIEKYGDLPDMLFAKNEDGEDQQISISTSSGIVLRTHQKNGWVRVNYYDIRGLPEGETFDGRWK